MIASINSYLGFTENIKEPRKTKVENELNRLYRYNGGVYNAITFLVIKLLEGCAPLKEENYQYYKRDGKLTIPKTLYKYVSPDGNTYFELNKTQYDFVCYLVEKELITEEKINKYVEDETARKEAEAIRQKEEERIMKERAEAEQEETRRVVELLKNDLENISDVEKSIASEVFFRIYGEVHDWNYSIIPLIHHFDIPLCKKEVKSRLHNDNRASIKIFEQLTGLKLPKGWKKRIEYLDTITSSDFKSLKL